MRQAVLHRHRTNPVVDDTEQCRDVHLLLEQFHEWSDRVPETYIAYLSEDCSVVVCVSPTDNYRGYNYPAHQFYPATVPLAVPPYLLRSSQKLPTERTLRFPAPRKDNTLGGLGCDNVNASGATHYRRDCSLCETSDRGESYTHRSSRYNPCKEGIA